MTPAERSFLSRSCPACSAAPGVPCRTPVGKPKQQAHLDRALQTILRPRRRKPTHRKA